MRRCCIFLMLALCLFCCGCKKTPPVSEDPSQAQEHTQDALKWATLPSCTGSGQCVNADTFDLPQEVIAPVLSLLDCYCRSIGTLEVIACRDLFAVKEEALRHEAIWRSLIEIRKASLIDLHLLDYDFTLRITDAQWVGDTISLTLTEDVLVHFTATPDTDTWQIGTVHTFQLAQQPDGAWKISSHSSDDNPYDAFVYDEDAACDARLEEFLQEIAQRQETRLSGGSSPAKPADHNYDRDAAYAYMQTYALQRKPLWGRYDDVGGNCQNFASQVLHAGGIPMDEDGDARWYWYSHEEQDYAWINVGLFMDYARSNTGYGLACDADADYYDGQTGDILIMGDGEYDHATVIADVICDEHGRTADYLICSNTTNYRNFPASAYYYTSHWLVRIAGWNE